MSGNLKLEDLKYGTLNDLSPAPEGNSGDRRRTNNMVALGNALEAAYSINTTVGVNQYNGIVIYRKDITHPVYQDRSSLLQEYTIQDNVAAPAGAPPNLTAYNLIAYKVYIPELEPRPAPGGKLNQCALLRTYPDVYSDVPQDIPLGSIVVVRFEDKERLFNPRIAKVVGAPLRITDITVDSQGNALEDKFGSNVASTLGQYGGDRGMGQKDYPGDYKGPDPAYLLPIQGKATLLVSSTYGPRGAPNTEFYRERGLVGQPQLHNGLDIPGPVGEKLQAIADGEVTHSANSPQAGFNIQIRHKDVINGGEIWTRYLHMAQASPLKKGDKVRRGDVVGLLGNTGSSTGPHLHFEINKSAVRGKGPPRPMNPIGYYPAGLIYKRGGEALTLHPLPDPDSPSAQAEVPNTEAAPSESETDVAVPPYQQYTPEELALGTPS